MYIKNQCIFNFNLMYGKILAKSNKVTSLCHTNYVCNWVQNFCNVTNDVVNLWQHMDMHSKASDGCVQIYMPSVHTPSNYTRHFARCPSLSSKNFQVDGLQDYATS